MVFVDTVHFVALLSPRDQWHNAAVRAGEAIQENLLTSEWVLVETANALSALPARRVIPAFFRKLQSAHDMGIVSASDPEWLKRGLELYESRSDKEWSLTDCVSFLIMRDYGITRVLSSDHHFVQTGFTTLLESEPPAIS